MPTLEERVEALEELISSIGEGGAQSFITLGPNGEVTYDFAGHISALGLDLLAGDDDTPPEDRKIRWLDEFNGDVVSYLAGYRSPGAYAGWANFTDFDANNFIRFINTASVVAPTPHVGTTLHIRQNGNAFFARVYEIENGLELSTFLINKRPLAPGSGSGAIDWGTTTVNVGGVNSSTVVVPHNLGVIPSVVMVTVAPNTVQAVGDCTAKNLLNITLRAKHRDNAATFGGGTVATLDWLAIG